ncbi:hypothetical protein [Neomoorella mulderi]|uniref:Uncharacterized protein n=1 Tax=Moorella mulderi DSM 14980 TaxID=1122241 RepID=A0A151AUW7_9FIRM|nr:hypothetical protein [Moorella mulderi]KYH31340.1 hypothetical protein MOMUL_24110 [Moorella mulderi DSM 14980]
MQWINTTDLKNWASTRDCEEYLPLVIRRLIRATAEDICHIRIPAGDSVVYPGWDGILETTIGNEYLPEGFSVWEIGTDQNIKKKAEKEYQKRKGNPLGVNPKETTFIFITPRIWTRKDEWCKEKIKEGFWKDVKVYDAEVLEEWLEQAPAVGAWLAKYLRIYPEGAIALEDFWIEWSSVTNPPLTSEVVLAGRDKQAESVRKWLNSSPSPLAVQAATSDEALVFLASVINTLPEIEREFILSKAIVLESSDSFRHITVTGRRGLLLIPRFAEIEGTPQATQRGHHVYIPLGPDNKVTTEKIELPRLKRESFIDALKKMGLSESDAQRFSKETGRSLTVLRRRLTKIANQPEWAQADSARDIIPCLLAGRWSEKKAEDKKIISQFAGKPYEAFSEKLLTWMHKSDSPVLKIGEWWRLVSPIDAWFALAPFITEADIQTFKKVALKVLGIINPALELEPQKRWLASIYGKEMPYSETLREGIAQTLVLIAVLGDDTGIPISTSAQTYVDHIVRELLHDADWKLWYSLSDVLPLIAEASPYSFLEAVEMSISQDDTPIMGMFSETGDPISSSSAHPSLLWALEGLAWNPQLLGRVTLILGKLAKLDPGGKLSNRPINSLRDIFLLWFPQTYATLEQRLAAIDTLIEREPEIGWKLLVGLMPRYHDTCTPTHKTRWRQFSEKTDVKTITELLEGIKAITSRLLIHVGSNGHRWAEVLDNFSALPPEDRSNVIAKLLSTAKEISKGRLEVWNRIRSILSRHRSFPDADWALPEKELKEIEKAYSLVEPQNPIERYCWLFEHWPELPEGNERDDYKKLELIIAQRRLEAVKVIKSMGGLQGLIKLAEQTNNPLLVGTSLSEVGLKIEEEEILLSLLEGEDDKKVHFVQGYIHERALKEGINWINSLVEKARSQEWQPNKIVNLFLAFPQYRVVWDLLETFNEAIQEAYWRHCTLWISGLPTEDKIYAINHLIRVKRNFTAIEYSALFAKEIPAILIAQVLRKAATEASSDDSQGLRSYHIEKLFNELDKSTEIKKEVIVQLEWLYLPILAGVTSTRPPKMLHRELTTNPEFFVEVLKYIYTPKNKDQEEEKESIPEDLLRHRANFAYELLHSWKTPPGSNSDGQIDYEKLKAWVVKARELCIKSDRREVGDYHIGQVLAYAKAEKDNIWPPEPVCKILDDIQSKDLDKGFSIAIYNKRGTVTKSLYEGGQQERELAGRFRLYASKWAIRYPRTATILTKIAEDYENEAKQEDKEAEIMDLEY